MQSKFNEAGLQDRVIFDWEGTHKDFYPGDDYVDLVSANIYRPDMNSDCHEESKAYGELDSFASSKMQGLSEVMPLPNMANCVQKNAYWLFYIAHYHKDWDVKEQ